MLNMVNKNVLKRINEFESVCVEFKDGTVFVFDKPTNTLEINHDISLNINCDVKKDIERNISDIVFISIVEDGKQIFKLDLRN